MKIKKLSKIFMLVMLMGAVLQAGVISYSIADNQLTINTQGTTETTERLQIVDIDSIDISQEILDLIKESNIANYEKNITNYKTLLVTLDVQSSFKEEIERLIKEGHYLPDLLVAYDFLNQSFGKVDELEMLSSQNQSGKTWVEIFTEYNQNSGEFIPSTFDPEYLEELLHELYITPDDIMIADRISFKLGIEHKEVIGYRIDGFSWRETNEELGILNSQSQLPRIQVTKEDIEKYVSEYNLTENQIVEAFVMAQKLGKTVEEILGKVKNGYSEEQIFAECYQEKYY